VLQVNREPNSPKGKRTSELTIGEDDGRNQGQCWGSRLPLCPPSASRQCNRDQSMNRGAVVQLCRISCFCLNLYIQQMYLLHTGRIKTCLTALIFQVRSFCIWNFPTIIWANLNFFFSISRYKVTNFGVHHATNNLHMYAAHH
jgi:hypothetical protein